METNMTAFTKPTDEKSAIAFLAELQAKGLAFHPDDSAREVLAHHGLTGDVLSEIERNMATCFEFTDPYIVGMGLGDGFKIPSEETLSACADLYEGEDVAMFWEWNDVLFAQLEDLTYLVVILMDEHRLQWQYEVKDAIRAFCVEEGVELLDSAPMEGLASHG